MSQELETLLETLPFFLQQKLHHHPQKEQLVEIILDLGRRPEVRFVTTSEFLSSKIVSWQDLEHISKRVSQFSSDNRAGIDRTLHRISCLRNRQFVIHGLTCRVGRTIFGTIAGIRDLLASEKSILLLGRPGIGKTTLLREMARVLANEMKKRVIIIDTSHEIAGDSDIPHSGIGKARRMQVAQTDLQHQVMMEAVENHMPEVILIDEIGTELEVLAARTIAEKGVQLVGTTHGNCLENLLKNPPLVELLGGIQSVTLSDDEAKKRNSQKTILERKTYPTFEIVIEINQPNAWVIHEDVKEYLDGLLRQTPRRVRQTRSLALGMTEKLHIRSQSWEARTPLKEEAPPSFPATWFPRNQEPKDDSDSLPSQPLILYPYSLSPNLLTEVLHYFPVKFTVTKELPKATLLVGSHRQLRQNQRLLQLAHHYHLPVYALSDPSFYQLRKLIQWLHS